MKTWGHEWLNRKGHPELVLTIIFCCIIGAELWLHFAMTSDTPWSKTLNELYHAHDPVSRKGSMFRELFVSDAPAILTGICIGFFGNALRLRRGLAAVILTSFGFAMLTPVYMSILGDNFWAAAPGSKIAASFLLIPEFMKYVLITGAFASGVRRMLDDQLEKQNSRHDR